MEISKFFKFSSSSAERVTKTTKNSHTYVKLNRRKGRPKLRWKDQVAKNLGVKIWRRRAENRVVWRGIIKEAPSKVGLYGR